MVSKTTINQQQLEDLNGKKVEVEVSPAVGVFVNIQGTLQHDTEADRWYVHGTADESYAIFKSGNVDYIHPTMYGASKSGRQAFISLRWTKNDS